MSSTKSSSEGVVDEGSPLAELICVSDVGIAGQLPVLLLECVHAGEILCASVGMPNSVVSPAFVCSTGKAH